MSDNYGKRFSKMSLRQQGGEIQNERYWRNAAKALGKPLHPDVSPSKYDIERLSKQIRKSPKTKDYVPKTIFGAVKRRLMGNKNG